MLPMTVRRRYDSDLDTFHNEFDQLFSRVFGDDPSRTATAAYPVDINEDENNIYVEAEMPGFRKDDISVTVEKGILTIEAERKPAEPKGERHLAERRFTRVVRRFTLPDLVDENKVDAHLEDGVLHLAFTKREEAKPRRIEVK